MAKVLIADGDEEDCELMRDIVSTWGHDVHKVFQGRTVLKCAVSHRPDVILLDGMLPGMNGLEVCRELKGNPQTSNIYVVMLTNFTEREGRENGFKAAADNFISKPIHYIELKYLIDLGLRKKQFRADRRFQQRICENFLKIMKIQNPELCRQSLKR